jgi:hypothetical protein
MAIEIKCSYSKLVSLSELKPNPDNPNVHQKEDLEAMIDVIKFNGVRHPIVVSNQTGLINCGHLRFEAFKFLLIDPAPVDFQDFDSYDKEYANMVADNALNTRSKLDHSLINATIPNLGPFDISVLGIKDFGVDPSESKKKKPKKCPQCGFEF